jgi:hypothetical protein
MLLGIGHSRTCVKGIIPNRPIELKEISAHMESWGPHLEIAIAIASAKPSFLLMPLRKATSITIGPFDIDHLRSF